MQSSPLCRRRRRRRREKKVSFFFSFFDLGCFFFFFSFFVCSIFFFFNDTNALFFNAGNWARERKKRNRWKGRIFFHNSLSLHKTEIENNTEEEEEKAAACVFFSFGVMLSFPSLSPTTLSLSPSLSLSLSPPPLSLYQAKVSRARSLSSRAQMIFRVGIRARGGAKTEKNNIPLSTLSLLPSLSFQPKKKKNQHNNHSFSHRAIAM